MSTNNTNQTEEIDLGYLFKKISDLFKSSVKILFQIIAFFLKYKFIVLALIIIGFAYGYYKDSNAKKLYSNQGIVIPNFESVDYLYNQVEIFNQKIQSGDSLFLKGVLGNNYLSVREIELEPISDIYNVMTQSREQIDVLRILFQNQDLTEFVEDMTTGKYFKYHRINFTVKGNENTEKVLSSIFNYWNSNTHYVDYAAIYRKNMEFQVEEYKHMIRQVDSVLASIGSTNFSGNTPNLYISDNSNLHLLVEQKQILLNGLLEAEKRQADYNDVIKVVSMSYDIDTKGLSNKLYYPILLVSLFSLVFLFINIYKGMKNIAEPNEL